MFPVPLAVFVKSLKGTKDEVWTKVLAIYHGSEKHTRAEWMEILDALRKQPAST